MGFVRVTDTEGREHVVHTSQLARAPGPWKAVWAKFDAQPKPPPVPKDQRK